MKQIFAISLFFFSLTISLGATPLHIKNKRYILLPDTTHVNMLKTKIKDYREQKQYDSTILYTKKLLRYSQQQADTNTIADAYFRLAYYYYNYTDKEDSAFVYYNSASDMYLKLENSARVASSLTSMANIQKKLGDYQASLVTAIDGLDHIENPELSPEIAVRLYHIISVASKEQNSLTEALEWNSKIFDMVHDYPSKIKNTEDILIYKNTRANILHKLGRHEEAVAIYKKLLVDSTLLKSKKEYARVLDNYAFTLWEINPKNDSSESSMQKALNIRKELNDKSSLIAGNIHLAQFYFQTDKVKALKHAEEALNLSQTINNPVSILESLDYILSLKKDLNKNLSEEAVLYSITNKNLQLTRQKIRALYASSKYNYEKLKLDKLKLKNLQAQSEVQLQKERNQKNIYLSLGLLGALSVIFLFFYDQQRNRINIINTTNATEARISQKIHDDLANNMYDVMTHIEANKKNEGILNKIELIYNLTRDISRQTATIETGPLFTEELKQMLSSYGKGLVNIMTKEIDSIPWDKIKDYKKTALYKVLQELMINMKKHSGADLVIISFSKDHENVNVEYADNGKGINNEVLIRKNGLANVENRISSINGNFKFDTSSGKGLKIHISFPA